MSEEKNPSPQIIHVKAVWRFDNGNCMVFGMDGKQIPELQGTWTKTRVLLMAPHVSLSEAEWWDATWPRSGL